MMEGTRPFIIINNRSSPLHVYKLTSVSECGRLTKPRCDDFLLKNQGPARNCPPGNIQRKEVRIGNLQEILETMFR